MLDRPTPAQQAVTTHLHLNAYNRFTESGLRIRVEYPDYLEPAAKLVRVAVDHLAEEMEALERDWRVRQEHVPNAAGRTP